MILTASSITDCLQRKRIVFFAPLLAIFMMAGQIAHADTRLDEATQLVEELVAEVQGARQNGMLSAEEKEALFSRVITDYFDVDGITRFTAGRYWRAANETERQEYSELFVDVLISMASSQFEQLATLEFTPTATEARGKKLILVRGIIHDRSGQQPDAAIAWRVASVDNTPPRIIDIEIENISMLKTQQDENTAIIRRNGGKFSALIEQLRKQLNNLSSS